MYIATKWNPIYWNCACLIVNSASLEDDEDDEVFEEDDDGNTSIKKEKTTDYAKIAKALGDIISANIKVSLVDINKSNFSFEPDIKNNQILFGMKALTGINLSTVEEIISKRPYYGIADFMSRCPLDKTAMISLIKAGAFDEVEKNWGKELNVHPRLVVMTYYLSKTSDLKTKLNLQNFNGLIQRNLIPEDLDFQRRVFIYNKYLKANMKVGKYYIFDEVCYIFYKEFFDLEQLEVINGIICIKQAKWDKMYQSVMDAARDWIKENQDFVLDKFNTLVFLEAWNKYAKGSLSAWEMESMCFYYNPHELENVNTFKYGISNFFDMPETPDVDYFFKRRGIKIPIYKTNKIIGTVIAKNNVKSSVDILTTHGVVPVKFTKEYYAMFNRQISEVQPDGSKKVKEKGWFTRGNKVMITGFRREDTFVAKSYSHTPTHQLYKILNVYNNGDLELTHERSNSNGE